MHVINDSLTELYGLFNSQIGTIDQSLIFTVYDQIVFISANQGILRSGAVALYNLSQVVKTWEVILEQGSFDDLAPGRRSLGDGYLGRHDDIVSVHVADLCMNLVYHWQLRRSDEAGEVMCNLTSLSLNIDEFDGERVVRVLPALELKLEFCVVFKACGR